MSTPTQDKKPEDVKSADKKSEEVPPAEPKKLHPDSEYIMQANIGPVIAKGLAQVYKDKPQNPVDFFAKWLLQQSNIAKREKLEAQANQKVEDLKKKEEYERQALAKEAAEKEKEKKALNDKIEEFRKKVKDSDDLNDRLQDLVDHLTEFTGASACYIGYVDKPIKGVKKGLAEDADDTAHNIPGAKQEIQFKYFSESCKDIMKDQILLQDQGVTYKLINDEDNAAINKNITDAKDGIPKHLFIEEVVRDKAVKYFQVPKLGSYLAMKMEYQTCLFEEAYEAAVINYQEINEQIKIQDQEKMEWENEQKEREEASEQEGAEPPEEKEWEVFEYAPFKTTKKQFVVCINTLGQDRKFTDQEKKFALETVKMFQETWENREKINLEMDVQQKINTSDFDRFYKENFEAQDETEIQKIIEETHVAENANKNDQGEDELTEAEKESLARIVKFKEITKGFWAPDSAKEYAEKMAKAGDEPVKAPSAAASQKSDAEGEGEGEQLPPFTPLIPEFWKEKSMEFGKLHVVRFPRILQSLFYLVRNSREDICEPDTNKLSWKQARKQMMSGDKDSIYFKMNEYWPLGPKEAEHKEYQKLKFIQSNINELNEDDVDEYSMVLGKIFRWLMMALELRIEDVSNRKKGKEKEREFRQDAIEREAERKERYEAALVEEKEAFEQKQEAERAAREEMEEGEGDEDPEEPDFDEAAFKENWDDENPPIEEPPEVVDDIDNDFNVEIEEDDQE